MEASSSLLKLDIIRLLLLAHSELQSDIYSQSPDVPRMAYPIPRFAGAPQTPQRYHSIETQRDAMARNTPPRGLFRRIIVCFLAIIILFLWWIGAFSNSSRRTDRIPFSHNSVQEQVREYPLFTLAANRVIKAILAILKDTKTAALHQQTSTSRHCHRILIERS